MHLSQTLDRIFHKRFPLMSTLIIRAILDSLPNYSPSEPSSSLSHRVITELTQGANTHDMRFRDSDKRVSHGLCLVSTHPSSYFFESGYSFFPKQTARFVLCYVCMLV